MNPVGIVEPAGMERIGLWVGLCMSLGLFSMIWREHRIARLLQYVLVGAATGWLFVLVWTSLIQPRVAVPVQAGTWQATAIGPLLLFLLLAAAAALPHPPSPTGPLGPYAKPIRVLKAAASLAATAILAFTAATVVGGMLVGTLLPQMTFAARTGWQLLATSLLTGLTLLACATAGSRIKSLPDRIAGVIHGVSALGQPLLMLAAGMVFARLMTSRTTLLGTFLEGLLESLALLSGTDWPGRLGG